MGDIADFGGVGDFDRPDARIPSQISEEMKNDLEGSFLDWAIDLQADWAQKPEISAYLMDKVGSDDITEEAVTNELNELFSVILLDYLGVENRHHE